MKQYIAKFNINKSIVTKNMSHSFLRYKQCDLKLESVETN